MKAKDYIRQLGMKAVANICNNNLSDIQAHLERECDGDCNYYVGLIKQYLKTAYNQPCETDDLKLEVIQILRKEFGNV